MSSNQSRRWCFTLNNYSADEYGSITGDAVRAVSSYGIVGKEVGEEGTPHLQGFIIFSIPRRLAYVRSLSGRAHWEPAKGNADQNYTYCSKDGDFIEWGTRPKAGAQGGIARAEQWRIAREAAVAGDHESVPDDIYIKHYGNIQRITERHMKRPEDLEAPAAWWIKGESGSGKSYVARSVGDYYVKNVNKWWCGYKGEENVIIDDIDPTHGFIAYYLKIWLDRYAFLGEMKGSSSWMRPRRIIITSQYDIKDVFERKEDQEAITRRCKVIQWSSVMRGRDIFNE